MNSIAEELTSDTIANDIRMQRADNKNTVLLIEGDTDARLFKKFITANTCTITVCFGRGNLLEIITKLHQTKFEKILGICDKDFAETLGYPEYQGFIVFTDNNDIEIDIISSPALENVLAEFGSIQKVKAVKADNSGSVSNFILNHAKYLGEIRLSSRIHNWNIDFKKMKFRFENANSPKIHVPKTIEHLIGRTEGWCGISKEEVLEICSAAGGGVKLRESCQGHDAIRILGRSLRRVLGSTNDFNDDKKARTLEQILRLAYEYRYFQATKMYKAMKAWEKLNQVSILKP